MKIFYLPDLGEGLPDAEIHEWLIQEGDEVKVDQPICSMETAKALVEVPSPCTGRIIKLYGEPGDIIKTGHPLVEFEQKENTLKEKKEDTGTVVGSIEVGNRVVTDSPLGVQPPISRQAAMKATPAVRALAKQLDVDLKQVTPTGPGGSITAHDVKKAGEQISLAPGYELLQGARRSMAMNMALAHSSVVPVTLVDDVDIQHFSPNEDITFRLIQALVVACQNEPTLNAHFDGKNLSRRLFQDVNIGLAIDTPKGLYVPVIKKAQSLSKEQIRETINDFKQQAAGQKFVPETLQEATITLSNFGVFVGRYASPIVVPPTVAIIAVGKLREEVVAVAGKPAIHQVMPISLTFDHRSVTGGEAARFIAAFMNDLQK
jgi:2-oxoisovalerate dehydrogenase E2 component (dihydrolipoyl transacylase)